jgi:hypothetical protein
VTDALDAGKARRARSGRPRRPGSIWVGAIIVALACVVGGALVIVRSAQSTPAPPAPLPARQFQNVALPPLAANETIPPATGGTVPGYDGANRVFVDSLGIDAPYVGVGIGADGLSIPADVHTVGRWTGGATVDATAGTVLLAGHVDYVGQGAGALYRLYQIQPGALVVVTDASGQRTSWRVTGLQVVQKAALPTDLFDAAGPRRLILVTCGGPLLRVTDAAGESYNTYRDNVIATAVPA